MKVRQLLLHVFLMCCALIVPTVSPAWADEYVASVTTKDGNTQKYTTLHEALEAARTAAKSPDAWDTTSVDVNILKDITFEETATSADWTPVAFDVHNPITINGNNHKIINLPDMLYQKGGSGVSGFHGVSGVNTLTINDLIFLNPKTTPRTFNAVIMGYFDSGRRLIFKNVHIQGATVDAVKDNTYKGYAGAFVGYAAGYNNQNDGPVYQKNIFENCSVTGSNITANDGGSAGGLIGHAAGNQATKITIIKTTVANNTITGSETNKTGAVFGTLGTCMSSEIYPDAAAYICAEVYSNDVKSRYVIGRIGSEGGTCYFTRGGKYDVDPTTTSDPAKGIITTEAGCVVLPFSNESDEGPYTVRPPRTALTITAKDQSIVYGNSISKTVSDVTCSGLNDGHTLSSITLTPSDSNVTSDGAVTPSGAVIKNGDEDVTDDYKVTYVNGKLTITEPEPEPEAESETDDSSGGGGTGSDTGSDTETTDTETDTTDDDTDSSSGGGGSTSIVISSDSTSGSSGASDLTSVVSSMSSSDKAAVTELIVTDNKNLTSLEGVEQLENLESINLNNCTNLESVNLSANTSLTNIAADNCASLQVIEVKNNENLETLSLKNAVSLQELDVSGCSSLSSLDCSGGNIENLNLNGCESLTDLNCQNNNLNSLDVSGCSELTTLECSANNLGSLNVDGCESLQDLRCSANSLSTLDLISCRMLERLYCYSNGLTEIKLSTTRLSILVCDDNNLGELKVEDNKQLKRLDCQNNSMPALDVTSSIFSSLERLKCYGQKLSGLNITSSGGAYQFDLNAYIAASTAGVLKAADSTSSSLDNISNIKAYDASGNEIEITSNASGVLTFASKPTKIVYDYDVGYNGTKMDVTISDNTNKSGSSSDSDSGSSSGSKKSGGGSGGGCNSGFNFSLFLLFILALAGVKSCAKYF